MISLIYSNDSSRVLNKYDKINRSLKPFLLITGMHRSGTSFLARTMNLCGVNLGGLDRLSTHDLKYDLDNLRGHWEHEKLKELSDETLSNNGGTWDKIPEKITISKEIIKKLKKNVDELTSLPGIASGFKDPRLILCYEAWKEHLPSNSVIIGIFRDPLKVAESLKTRNQFDYEKSLSLWQKYNTSLLELLEKNSGFLLNFDWPQKQLFSEINLVATKLGLIEPDLSNWYSSDLLHSDKTFSKYIIPDHIKSLYKRLEIRSEENSKINTIFPKTLPSESYEILKSMIKDSEESGNYFRKINENNLQKIHDLSTDLSNTKNSLKSSISDVEKLHKINLKQSSEFKKELEQKQEEIKNLNEAIESYQNFITEIHQSFVFRALHKYDKTIGKKLPLRPKRFLKSNSQHQSDDEQKHTVMMAMSGKLEKKDILSFPIINWNFRYQRPQHLLTRFAKKGHRVFYFTVNLRKLKNSYEIQKLQENIYQVELNSPTFFDIYKDTFKPESINAILKSFDELQKDLNVDAVSYVQFPTWAGISLELKKRYGFKIIFDCLDDFVGFDNVSDERIKEEQILFSNSDLVSVSSLSLMQKATKFTNNHIFLPNACEFEHFNKSTDSEILSKFRKPIIGYFGSIADWFDTDLLEYVAKKCTDCSFVMIGHTLGSDIRKLKNFENIHFMGERPYSELPKYLHGFDVCLIPFKKIPLIHATHPIKIYEYFAAGKPVVTTDMPELHPMKKMCYISATKEDFLANTRKAINETDKSLQKGRIEFASKNTWEERFEKLYDKLLDFDINHHN